MSTPTGEPHQYRPAAGIVLFNAQGQVWLGKRAGNQTQHIWQFPQGGIDPGESPEFAAIRELREETGISIEHLSPLGQVERELFYDFPKDYAGKGRVKNWRGQRQSWFAFRFNGDANHINLNFHSPAEFTDWRWAELSEAPMLIIPFKRKVYDQLVIEFEAFARSIN